MRDDDVILRRVSVVTSRARAIAVGVVNQFGVVEGEAAALSNRSLVELVGCRHRDVVRVLSELLPTARKMKLLLLL